MLKKVPRKGDPSQHSGQRGELPYFFYFAMLIGLFFTGVGRFLSIDYWVNRRLECRLENK